MFQVLENKFKLKDKVAVFVPSTSDVNQVVDNEKYINETLELLSKMFGGASAEDVKGAWVSEQYGLVVEEIKNVYAYASELNDENVGKIVEYCEKLKLELNQEAIGLEVNGEFYLI